MNRWTLNVRLGVAVALVALTSNATYAEVITQLPGTDYLVVEGEGVDSILGVSEHTDFAVVTSANPLETDFESLVLPPDTNASGGAGLYDQPGGDDFSSIATWQLRFDTPGLYTLYYHYSMFELANDADYGNEDSFYLALDFNQLPEQAGRSDLSSQAHNNPHQDPPYWEGRFHWQTAALEDGSPAQYHVRDQNVGTVLDFRLGSRQNGGALDLMLFSVDPDLSPQELDDLVPGTIHVAGVNNIGGQTVDSSRQNEVFGQPGEISPGLLQEWFKADSPGEKQELDHIFETTDPAVPPFRAGHGSSWWTGSQAPIDANTAEYPAAVIGDAFNDNDNDAYVVRATGGIYIPESGAYRFTDGVGDYAYWAIDTDRSGVAGDSAGEVIIDDNAWTNLQRESNDGGGPIGEIDIDVADGGEWLALEFNMGERTGTDAGIIYWDYDLNDLDGDGVRLGDARGFPVLDEDQIDLANDAPNLYVPNLVLRSAGPAPLISADLTATLSRTKDYEFEINGDTDTTDQLDVENTDPNIFATVLNADGATFRLVATGNLEDGDSFDLIDADQIIGAPEIVSAVPGQSWAYDPATGEVTFGGFGLLQAGDAEQDFDFDQFDLIQVQQAARYLTGLPATWGEGDWNGAPGGQPGDPPLGDGFFDQFDIVQSLQAAIYLTGHYAAIESDGKMGLLADGGDPGNVDFVYVPEPGTIALAILGVLIAIVTRRCSAGTYHRKVAVRTRGGT